MGKGTERDKARQRMEIQTEVVSFLVRGGMVTDLGRGPIQPNGRTFTTLYGVPMQVKGEEVA